MLGLGDYLMVESLNVSSGMISPTPKQQQKIVN